ncbi:alanine-phosphoribitol ligase [Streptomyces sp. NRRL B-1140]|uniref:amino acid adenylation domain-containing protein n=1 Tax=Streptomyces sp. NRRL B-1140 TaxID=1415549 RepID=UPI0006AE7D61|nr:amino acid adenylation domain-containing protein [Streptomyces sp. NRRL B-1140]KOX04366.1 alanine-phosphoribitol ligase [Streptomyces sp. NRRL B-1140]
MAAEGRTLTDRFQDVVERFPDKTAVTTAQGEVTYRQLDERADALGHALTRTGVRPGAVVALLAPRDADLLVGMLGILKAGAAYLPIDPGSPADRIRWTVEDSRSPVVVSTAALSGPLCGLDADVVLLDSLPAAPSRADRAKPPSADGDDLAYVIYTSGSTGLPKGVKVEHRSVVRLFDVTQPLFGFDENDVWSAFHSAAFDFSAWEIWGALLFGGRLVMVPQETARSPKDFHALLLAQGVTVLNQTPSAFRRLAATQARAAHPLPRLRTVVLGGERLDPATLRPWVERHGDEHPRLVNMYGITEATVHSSYRRLLRADLEGEGPSPIGEPLPDLAFHVLDEDERPVEEGEPGELYIEGPGLARGYLSRPDLDKERFVEVVGADGVPRRCYRTGDRIVALPGGGYGYLGRTDDQLKIRGHRVEPGEIESLIDRHPDVTQSVVLPHDHGEDDVRLIAYVASRTAGPELAAVLAERAAAALPAYMRPSRYVVLPELPLTLNGKVDTARLPSPQTPRASAQGPDAAGSARTGTEERIAEVWRAVLDVPRVERDADFFDLGGTSLSLLRMFDRVNEVFGLDLDITVLIDGATVRLLGRHVDAALTASPTEETA